MDCLGKSYNAMNSQERFCGRRAKLQNDVIDEISGKKAGQELFDVIGSLENLKNLEYLETDEPSLQIIV